MQRKIEGLLISKMPYKDRHAIGRLMLRNGKKVSVLFFGGQGGGKKQKSSNLELGYMLKVELNASKGTEDLYSTKEWKPVWLHENIRLNHRAFYLMCFYLEVLDKLSILEDLHDEHSPADKSFDALFSVASNAVFFLENSLKSSSFNLDFHGSLFLAKLLVATGVFPDISMCIFCGKPLENINSLSLNPLEGGFSCNECSSSESEVARELWRFLKDVSQMKYSDFSNYNWQQINIFKMLLNYFCIQSGLNEMELKSVGFVV